MTEVLHRTFVATRAGDPLEYVMSDETLDSHGTIIEAKAWDLSTFSNNPTALFAHGKDPTFGSFPIGSWEGVRIAGRRLVGKLRLLPAETSERFKELRAAVEAGVLRTVSVGFRVKPGGVKMRDGIPHYTDVELVECSLVPIPSNPNALALARALNLSDDAQQVIFGKSADEIAVLQRAVTGESASTQSRNPIPRKPKMATLAERITSAQEDIVGLKDQLAEHVKSDDVDQLVVEDLSDRIEAKETELAAFRRAESALAVRAADAAPVVAATVPASPARRPHGIAGRDGKPSDIIIRSAAVFAVAEATGKAPEHILEKMYGEDETTGMVIRAAVAGATTTTTGWAAELVNTAMTDFLESLRPMSVYPALAAAGGGRLAFGPNQGAIKIPARAATPSIGGSFVGEGAPIPVRRLGLSSITLSPKKMGVISVFSREIARYGTPAIEALIRQEILNDTAITIDALLLDATAGSSVRPAGLLNGVTPITATTGGGYEAILGDFRKLRAPFDTANAGTGLMVLMNPAQSEGLDLTPGADGTLGWARDIVARYQIATSSAIPVGTVIMLRAADFVSATGDVPEFETSNDATIHMEDTTPLQIGSTGTPNTVAAPVQSMFQTAQTAIRMLLDVSWAMRRSSMVQVVEDVTW